MLASLVSGLFLPGCLNVSWLGAHPFAARTTVRNLDGIDGIRWHTKLSKLRLLQLEWTGSYQLRMQADSGRNVQWTVAAYSRPYGASPYPPAVATHVQYLFCAFDAAEELSLCGWTASYAGGALPWIGTEKNRQGEALDNHQLHVEEMIKRHGAADDEPTPQVSIAEGDDVQPSPALSPVRMDWCRPTLVQVMQGLTRCSESLALDAEPILGGRVGAATLELLTQLALQEVMARDAGEPVNPLYMLFFHEGRSQDRITDSLPTARNLVAEDDSQNAWPLDLTRERFSTAARKARDLLLDDCSSVTDLYAQAYLLGLADRFRQWRYSSAAVVTDNPHPIARMIARGYLDGAEGVDPQPFVVRQNCPAAERCYSFLEAEALTGAPATANAGCRDQR